MKVDIKIQMEQLNVENCDLDEVMVWECMLNVCVCIWKIGVSMQQ